MAVRHVTVDTANYRLPVLATDATLSPVQMVNPATGSDDSSMIQSRITAGRTTQLRSGTYQVASDLVPATGCTIAGAPDGTTVIKVTSTNRGFAWTNVPGVTLRDLTIDCNKANTTDNGTTTQHGVHILANNSTGSPRTRLERVKIINAWDRGFNAQATTLDTHPLEVELIDVVISGCGTQGAFISNSTRTRVIRGEYASSLYGCQVVGGRDAVIDGARAHDNTDHGLVANTAISGVRIINNECWNNGGVNDWGIVVGINATRFIVANNHCYANAGGITIDVADTVTNPIDTRGVVSGNVCTASTLSDGIHVNQCDGLTIVGNTCVDNEQDGISVYGRNCEVVGNVCHHNGRDGINFEEDLSGVLATCGPHRCSGNHSYTNNQNAGSWVNFFSAALTNGPVLWDVSGTGTPESVLTGGIGSTFRRTDGGAGTSLYVKESGTSNTGWVGK